jgi:hypothetical protein
MKDDPLLRACLVALALVWFLVGVASLHAYVQSLKAQSRMISFAEETARNLTEW